MILEQYKSDNLLFNTNFMAQSSHDGLMAYRGDLIIEDGGLDDKGHPNPPKSVFRAAVLLGDSKLTMAIGGLDRIDLLPALFERFGENFGEGMPMAIFSVNSKQRAKVMMGSVPVYVLPLVQGVPWNEMMEELAMEKSDFKGQSPADKLYTMFQELNTWKPKSMKEMSLEELLADVSDQVREVWGAV